MTDIDHAAILRQHADTRRRGHSVNPDVLRAAADEIERLRAERNEARIKLCRLDAESRSQNARISGFSDHYYSPKQIANERGWDCFKEDSND